MDDSVFRRRPVLIGDTISLPEQMTVGQALAVVHVTTPVGVDQTLIWWPHGLPATENARP